MEITTSEKNGIVVMGLHGELDASNYQDTINTAKEYYADGKRSLVIDLSGLSFMSSAGLVALYSIASIMESKVLPGEEAGWNTFQSMGKGARREPIKTCKLLSPQPDVDRSLEISGFKAFFEVFTDMEKVLASF